MTWRLFCRFPKLFGEQRGRVLSFCGPVILVQLVAVWSLGPATASGLIVHPYLGTSVRANRGATSTDFVSALYVGAESIAVIGASEFTPETTPFRLLFLFNSLAGMSVVTLSLTYMMQIYNALQRRNTLSLKMYLLSGQTRDASELLAGLGPQGEFNAGYTNICERAAEMTKAKESHHFYPVLFYFRFAETFYSTSLSAALALDCVALMKSALDDQLYGWLKESGAVTQLSHASLLLVQTLERTFLPGGVKDVDPPDGDTEAQWRRRVLCGLQRLKQANIATTSDEEAGASNYVKLRTQWFGHVMRLAGSMAFTLEDIDPVVTDPDDAYRRPDFETRLHE